MSQEKYAKPLPQASPETKVFWEKTKAHELWIPWCRPCDKSYWFPRDFCPSCGSRDVQWRRSSGRGTVYTFAIQHRAWHPGWANEIPYVTALVELEEGVRMFSNLIGVDPTPQAVSCDMPVEAVFEDATDEVTLVKFQPRRTLQSDD